MASPSPTPLSLHSINLYFTITVAASMILIIVSLLLYSYRCLTSAEILWQRLKCRIRREPSAAVETMPVCRYRNGQSFSNECSVCLTAFEEGEKVRQLPACRHSFHAPCIDEWLCSQSSCPSCRAFVLKGREESQRTEAVVDTGYQQQQLTENRSVAVGIASE